MPVGTPLRNIRVAEDVWQQWRMHAQARGVSVSELVRAAVAAYLADQPNPAATRAPKPAVVAVETRAPKPKTSACRQCSTCTDYRPNPRRMLHCTCGHGIGQHP
jgi:hypothetical protein